ncbi:hypothetical protein L6452_01661 [Arctium lappa]|uniref:Uncharacterized protein n=1 Tax=Arctium lappa TaxID=4217 RepID=A0ACB9FI30_ARCLA|nr:hypothetical protein L6452_01661 [Arctium lappa]
MDRSMAAANSGMDLPIMHDSDRTDLVRDIGSGNFGVARLIMRDKQRLKSLLLLSIFKEEKRRIGGMSSPPLQLLSV